jgi:hypothetical protein
MIRTRLDEALTAIISRRLRDEDGVPMMNQSLANAVHAIERASAELTKLERSKTERVQMTQRRKFTDQDERLLEVLGFTMNDREAVAEGKMKIYVYPALNNGGFQLAVMLPDGDTVINLGDVKLWFELNPETEARNAKAQIVSDWERAQWQRGRSE